MSSRKTSVIDDHLAVSHADLRAVEEILGYVQPIDEQLHRWEREAISGAGLSIPHHLRFPLSLPRGTPQELRQLYTWPLPSVAMLVLRVSARPLDTMASFHRMRHNLESAEHIYRETLHMLEQSACTRVTVTFPRILGHLRGVEQANPHIRDSLYAAERMHREALAIYQRLGGKEGMAAARSILGHIYFLRYDLNTAEKMHREALAIYQQLGNIEGILAVHANLTYVHHDRGDLTMVEKMYREVLAISEQLADEDAIATAYSNLGYVHYVERDFDAAEEMYRKALAIGEQFGSKEGVAHAYTGLGHVHHKRGDIQAAEQMYHKALALYTAIGALSSTIRLTALLSRIKMNRIKNRTDM